MRFFTREGSSKYSILFAGIIAFSVFTLLAFALTGNVSNVTFEQNSSARFDKEGIFTLNWTLNGSADTAMNYTIYAVNNSDNTIFYVGVNDSTTGFSFNATVTSAEGNYSFNISSQNATGEYGPNTTSAWVVVDKTVPRIDYLDSTSPNNTYANRNWIFVNVSLNETYVGNITFRLYNATALVSNQTNYTNASTFHNFTNLAKNSVYYYNVTVYDNAANANQTATRQITLSGLEINQSSAYDFGASLNVTNVSGVSVNITNRESVNATSLTQSKVLQLNLTQSTTFTSNTSKVLYYVVPSNVTSIALYNSSTNLNAILTSTAITSIPSNGGIIGVNVTVRNISSADVDVVLQLTFNTSRYLSSDFNSSDTNLSNGTNRTVALNFTVPSNTIAGLFKGNVTYNSSVGYDFFDFTANVTTPVIYIVSNFSDAPVMEQNGSLYVRANPMRGNATFNITVANRGNSALNGISAVFANVSFTNTTRTINFTNTSISPSLSSGTNESITLVFDLTGNHSGDQNYTNTLRLSTTNGQPYAQQNVTVVLEITNDVAMNSTISTGAASPNSNITVNITVKYQDGTPVLGLNKSHFYVNDTHTASSTLRQTWDASDSILNNSFTNDTQGNYAFVITSDNSAGTAGYGGAHTLLVRMANSTYEGTNTHTYTLNAPHLDISYGDTVDLTSTDGNKDNFTVSLLNTGAINLTSANVTISSNATSVVSISGATTCTVAAYTTNTSSCSSEYTAEGAGAALIRANVTATVNSVTYSYLENSGKIQVSAVSNSSSTPAGGGGGGGGNESDDESDELSISISDITIVKGGSKTHKIKVNNTGEGDLEDLTLSLSVPTGWPSNWYKVSKQPGDLLTGNAFTASVTLTVPKDAKVGKTTVTVTAEANDGDVSKEVEFTIQVDPTEEDLANVNGSITSAEYDLATLAQTVQAILAEDKNNTNALEAQKNIEEIETLLNEAKNALESGDSFKAYELNEQIKQKIADTESLLTTAKATVANGGSILGWILVVLFVAVASISGLVYYMWLPPKTEEHPMIGSYKANTSFAPKQSTSSSDRYTELKKKMKDYLENMKKKEENSGAPSYNYQKRNRWQ